MRDLDARLDRLAALGEPVRRALYTYVRTQPEWVSREDAAAAVGVAHHTAKFHLDRLVADGLLAFEYRRPPGRGGPGAGRPAKVYRAAGDLEVSVPPRRYDLAGRLLVRALAASARSKQPVERTVAKVARDAGREEAKRSFGPNRLLKTLDACGYEPSATKGMTVLTNCPFHDLAEEDRALVCGMNLAFVQGVLEGLGANATAELAPSDGRCCVRVTGA